MSDQSDNPFLTVAEATACLRLKKRTLDNMRWMGTGPNPGGTWRTHLYHVDELNEWSLSSRRNSSSSIENGSVGFSPRADRHGFGTILCRIFAGGSCFQALAPCHLECLRQCAHWLLLGEQTSAYYRRRSPSPRHQIGFAFTHHHEAICPTISGFLNLFSPCQAASFVVSELIFLSMENLSRGPKFWTPGSAICLSGRDAGHSNLTRFSRWRSRKTPLTAATLGRSVGARSQGQRSQCLSSDVKLCAFRSVFVFRGSG